MNILFIGKSCPLNTAHKILQQSGKNPGYQIIKFMDLILKGFVSNQQNISVITNVSNPNNFYSSAKIEVDNGIHYKYLPTIRVRVLSQLFHTFYSFIYTIEWFLKTKGDKCILCDIIASSSSCSGSLFAAKLLNIKTCMLLTDMIATPVTTPLDTKKWWWRTFLRLRVRHQQRALKKYDFFVFLTKQMNDIYNPLHKKYIVMEGSVDHTFVPNTNITKKHPHVVMYAGAIEAEYGFNELLQAFIKLPNPDIELHIYGNGKFVDTLLKYQEQDKRIKYMGVVSNEAIIEAEQMATLLINPRLSNQEYTKYSFPSKTSEYMLSGTPLLTTKLPGIPDEYWPHLYSFEEDTIQGFTDKMNEILSYTDKELKDKGLQAQQFVLSQKSNIIQSKRIIDFFIQNIK